MTNKLPQHLRGPFTNAIYEKHKATLYLKDRNGEWVSTDAYPSFFIEQRDVKRFPFDDYGKDFLEQKEEGKYLRIVRDPRMDRDDLREMIYECNELGLPIYEADVTPIRRWFSDTGALVSQKFRSLYFDFETDPQVPGFSDDAKKQHRIISFAAMDEEGNSWFEAAAESSAVEEKKLLEKFFRIIKGYDVVLAWNGDDYDFFVLKARLKRHKMRIDLRDWCWLDQMRVVKKVMGSISDADFKRSMKLDAIGENILGIRKIRLTVPPNKMKRLLGARVNELKEYNLRDVEIMLQLEQRKEFLALHYMVCSMCRTFPSRGSIYPNELTDGMMLRLAIKQGQHFPTRDIWAERDDSKKNYEGAYVMTPDVGFHENVQVPDFASLYPSIILSYNMSNETRLKAGKSPDGFDGRSYSHAEATGECFRNDIKGMIPMALQMLIEKRGEYKKKAKLFEVGSEEYKNMTNLSTAVKVVANSFYGLLGNKGSRFADQDIARSITLTGQLLIRKVAWYFEQKGYRAVYGDTDSIFVKCSEEEMYAELDELNDVFLPGILTACGCKPEHFAVKLDFDKGFSTFLLQAKKKYVGRLSLAKGRRVSCDVEPEVKGLETQRSDQVRYGQALLKRFMNMLIDPEANPTIIDQMIRDEADLFFTCKLKVEDIEIAESVRRHPESYDVKTPPVKVAQILIDSGEEFFEGMKVPYVVIESKPNVVAIPAERYEGKCDRVYYWKKRILPPILRLIAVRFPDYPFNDFMSPGQIILDFTGTEKPKKRRVRQSMEQRRVRKPLKPGEKPEKTLVKRRRRVPMAKVAVPPNERPPIMKAIADMIRAYPGDMPLTITVITDEGEVHIKTQEHVSMNGLAQLAKSFPALTISPSPL